MAAVNARLPVAPRNLRCSNLPDTGAAEKQIRLPLSPALIVLQLYIEHLTVRNLHRSQTVTTADGATGVLLLLRPLTAQHELLGSTQQALHQFRRRGRSLQADDTGNNSHRVRSDS